MITLSVVDRQIYPPGWVAPQTPVPLLLGPAALSELFAIVIAITAEWESFVHFSIDAIFIAR
jgi:hypothetical protein